jgi:hypothetical protein
MLHAYTYDVRMLLVEYQFKLLGSSIAHSSSVGRSWIAFSISRSLPSIVYLAVGRKRLFELEDILWIICRIDIAGKLCCTPLLGDSEVINISIVGKTCIPAPLLERTF